MNEGQCIMKKAGLLLVLPLILGACSNTEDMTLDRLIFGHEVKPEDTTLSEILFGKDCRTCKKKQAANIETEVVEVDDAETEYLEYVDNGAVYRLPTPGSPYLANAPTPETYAIAATRATNRMLDESGALYENNGSSFIYVTDLKKADRQLPDGVYNAAKTTKNIIKNSRTFKVVDNQEEADYILEPVIDNAGTPEEPVLVYKLILFDTDNNKAGQWTETLRRVRNDDGSWW